MARSVSLLLLLLSSCGVFGQDVAEEDHEPSGALSALQLPSELNLSDGFIRAVGTAGVLVTSIAGVAALLSFLLPLFGFRTCALLGTCDNGYEASGYSAGVGSNSVYDQQGFQGYGYGNGAFRKRSLEYVGPILKALSAAYDKYGPKVRAPKQLDAATPK